MPIVKRNVKKDAPVKKDDTPRQDSKVFSKLKGMVKIKKG